MITAEMAGGGIQKTALCCNVGEFLFVLIML